MTVFRAIVIAFVLSFSSLATAQSYPSYEMRGTFTDLWPGDVDYYSPPIELVRTDDTRDRHFIHFEVASYRRVCLASRRVCVARDRRGRCVRYAIQCVRWGQQKRPIRERLQIEFRDLPALAQGEEETYQLEITRQRPPRDGRDWVRTWLRAISTNGEVRVRQINDYRYIVEPAPEN